MSETLTLDERFELLKAKTTCIDGFNDLKQDLYSFSFNHPYYSGDSGMTDDEARHSILDDFDIPRK